MTATIATLRTTLTLLDAEISAYEDCGEVAEAAAASKARAAVLAALREVEMTEKIRVGAVVRVTRGVYEDQDGEVLAIRQLTYSDAREAEVTLAPEWSKWFPMEHLAAVDAAERVA